MHRSGTSAITRGLQVMGVDLGERLMPAHQEVNAKGFWEDLDFNALNNDMLYVIGNDWHCLSPVSKQDVEMLQNKGFYTRAMELLSAKIDDSPVFGVKDPRITKLLSFWKEVFEQSGLDVYYVLSLRNPMSVAKSLSKRDNFDFDKSCLLWLEHVLESLSGSQGAKRVLVDYDLLISAPDVELKKIATTTGLIVDPVEFEKYRSEFLDESLRHNTFSLEELRRNEDVPPLVFEVFEALQDVARNKTDLAAPSLLQQVKVWFRRLDDMKHAMKKVVQNASHKYAEHNREIISLKHSLSESDKQIASLKHSLSESDKQIASLKHSLSESDKQIASLKHSLSESDKQIADIFNSHLWKATVPIRYIVNIARFAVGHSRDFLIGLLRRIYHRLPLSTVGSNRLKGWLYSRFPGLFSHTLSYSLWKSQTIGSRFERISFDLPREIGEPFEFLCPADPMVSIVIPVYGKIEYTYSCLRSLWLHHSHYSFEIIVVDDCSPDNTLKVLETIKGVRIVRNETNLGFIRSCNRGASHARGKLLVMLNNDTVVCPGWLDALVRTFDTFPGTGLVGSKLIYPDGSLQEAGCIIWQDGSAWNFGRNQDPGLPVFNYAREVDYCSGASVMITKSLFLELGGFDEHYLPAYCEDCDLALKIRENGYRVIYQPLSAVVHFEGATSGTDIMQGVKVYQVENSKKLFARWRERLKKQQPNGMDVDDAKDRCSTRRVLVLDHCTPTPNKDSGSIDIYNIMQLLREMNFQVTFIPEDNFLFIPEYTAMLQGAGIEVLYSPYVTSVEQHLRDWGNRYDLVLLFRVGVVERNIKIIRKYCFNAKVLYQTVDLHYLRMLREAALFGDDKKQQQAKRMKETELALIQAVDMAMVISYKEIEELSREMPLNNIRLLPFSRHIRRTDKSFMGSRDIIFVGGYQHAPNLDAVQFFVAEIMPILRQLLSGFRFHVVGSNTPEAIMALAAEDIVVHGFVEDLDSLLYQMRINVAPLRYGAGIKGKIGSAMAVGLPTVGTTIAVEGMSLINGKNILVADGADAIANAIAKLYEDEILWTELSAAGLEFAEKAWSGEAVWKKLANILAELGIKVERGNRPLKLYS